MLAKYNPFAISFTKMQCRLYFKPLPLPRNKNEIVYSKTVLILCFIYLVDNLYFRLYSLQSEQASFFK